MMLLFNMDLRSSDVASGDGWPTEPLLAPTAEGVLLCLVRYDDDRGRDGREAPAGPWIDDRRLVSGEVGADEAGDLPGGV